jgi:hypothetical protein
LQLAFSAQVVTRQHLAQWDVRHRWSRSDHAPMMHHNVAD